MNEIKKDKKAYLKCQNELCRTGCVLHKPKRTVGGRMPVVLEALEVETVLRLNNGFIVHCKRCHDCWRVAHRKSGAFSPGSWACCHNSPNETVASMYLELRKLLGPNATFQCHQRSEWAAELHILEAANSLARQFDNYLITIA